MSKQLKKSRKKGFSLVELIISVALLVAVLLPISVGFISAAAINKKSKDQIKINSVTRTVKERVVDEYIKNKSTAPVVGTDDALAGYKYEITINSDDTTNKIVDLKVKIKTLKSDKVVNVFNIKVFYG